MPYYTSSDVIVIVLLLGSVSLFALTESVEYIEGDVFLTHEGETEYADFGSPIFQDDLITTEADSLAVIRLSDGTALKIRENTIIRIAVLSDSAAIDLHEGSFFSKVTKQLVGRYTVKTPTVVAGVRGTEFFIAYGRTIDDQADVWLCVDTGEVEVAVPETEEQVIVRAGEGINILAGLDITRPKKYKWTEDLNWNIDPSKGDVLDRTDLDAVYSDLLDLDYD